MLTPFRQAVMQVANRWACADFPDEDLEHEICKATRCSFYLAKWIARRIRNLTF